MRKRKKGFDGGTVSTAGRRVVRRSGVHAYMFLPVYKEISVPFVLWR